VQEDEELDAVFAEFDAFIESLPELRENSVSILNYPKIGAMRLTCEAIKKALRGNLFPVTVTCRQSELVPDMGGVSVEGKQIELVDTEWFRRAAEFADNMEVYPLADDKVRLTFGFNGLLQRIM